MNDKIEKLIEKLRAFEENAIVKARADGVESKGEAVIRNYFSKLVTALEKHKA